MNRRMKRWTVAVLAMSAVTGASAASGQDAAVLKDLAAVIALNGQSCGQVVSAVRQKDNDYVATCRDGNRYRVFTNPEGRVVVQKV